METKEIKITPPEGYEIDRENSTLDCIKFKKVAKRWRDNKDAEINGYWIASTSSTLCHIHCTNNPNNYNTFLTKKHGKSALAMARISQIMANDERFGGIITDEEWNIPIPKYVIIRNGDVIVKGQNRFDWRFLAFHTIEQRDLFLEENEDLVKEYFMLE